MVEKYVCRTPCEKISLKDVDSKDSYQSVIAFFQPKIIDIFFIAPWKPEAVVFLLNPLQCYVFVEKFIYKKNNFLKTPLIRRYEPDI